VEKKPGLLSELLSKQEEQKAERQRIAEALLGLTGRSGFLESVAYCAKELEKQGFRGLNVLLVRAVMREDLGMRYRKVRELSLHENSVRNLVLRQRWGMRLLQLASQRTRIVNIDESWLGMEDFRRMKWELPGTRNSVPKKAWAPRISLLVALDNFGKSYVAVSQSNTNSQVFKLFIRGLVKLFNEETRRWREKTLIYVDGASYHKSEVMLEVYKELEVPVAFSAPNSYSAAPCELWFSLFKRAHINPRLIKTGKR
jgi:hypothetical protein